MSQMQRTPAEILEDIRRAMTQPWGLRNPVPTEIISPEDAKARQKNPVPE